MKYSVKATIYNKRNRIISMGYNSYTKTHPKQYYYATRVGLSEKCFLHAEIAALIKCKEYPYKIVIERYGKDGRPMLAKPCPICLEAIKDYNVKIVEFTGDDLIRM